ncbi:MAG: ferredoxin [Proteobacteria bacterium]|nr:MAG: ferredoxin [Pseudomonadota bacterium]
MAKLSEIKGITIRVSYAFEAQGIKTVEAFLESCSTRKGREQLAESTGLSPKDILTWANRADLARIKGIATQNADLLEAAGVDTVPELAQRNPDNLYAAILEENNKHRIVSKMASLNQVKDWVAQAKELPRVITY